MPRVPMVLHCIGFTGMTAFTLSLTRALLPPTIYCYPPLMLLLEPYPCLASVTLGPTGGACVPGVLHSSVA